jgi:protein-tyrosine phosphatase
VSIPTPDFKPVPKNIIAEGVRAIEDNIGKSKVYVHCKSGKGRSAVIVLAYVMKKIWETDKIDDFSKNFQKAVRIVTESRSANKVRRVTDSKAGPLIYWFDQMLLRTPQ